MCEFFFEATIAATEDAAEGIFCGATILNLSTDRTTLDDHFSTYTDIFICRIFGRMESIYLTQLTTAINVTFDNGSATDGQLRTLHLAQFKPVF